MAFNKGNQFWRQAASYGRDMIFSSPDLMWESAKEYFQWMDEHPIEVEKPVVVDKQIRYAKEKLKRPYTLKTLCLFLGVSESYFRAFKSTATEDKKDFLTVIARIEDCIFSQKFEGAAVGQFKENLIARDLGLADKKDIRGNLHLDDAEIEFS